MKKTRVVEYEVCDLCGREKRWPNRKIICRNCNVEICECCQEVFCAEVRRSVPYIGPITSHGEQLTSYSVSHIRLKMDMNFCCNCATVVFKELSSFGFVESEEKVDKFLGMD